MPETATKTKHALTINHSGTQDYSGSLWITQVSPREELKRKTNRQTDRLPRVAERERLGTSRLLALR